MTANRYTSRVFVAGVALYDALTATTWPAHPVTGRVPTVEFSDEDPSLGAETVTVGLNADQTQIGWRRLSPPGADEQIGFDVVARTVAPNMGSSRSVWDRLAVLSATIEGVLYDTTATALKPLGFDGETDSGRVVAVRPQVVPGPEGWIGAVTVSIDLQAQI